MSNKIKVKVEEKNYGTYEVCKALDKSSKDVYYLKYGHDDSWVDSLQGRDIMCVTDTGNGVTLKDLGADPNFGKIKLDYGSIYELYILLTFYFKSQGSSYSEFDFIREEKVFKDKEEQKEILTQMMEDDANFYE